MPGEIDLRPLLELLHTRGLFVALPETTPRGQPLIFRRWKPDSTMVAEKFGTFRPDGPELTPDLFLVPLLAFDRAGGRSAMAAGYYDRTLPLHPGKPAWGFAYAAQEVDKLPMEPHDHRLDAIVTEAASSFRTADKLPCAFVFLGDVVGRAGRDAVGAALPPCAERFGVDLAIVNGENASHGFGLAPAMADALFAARRRRHHAWQPRLGPASELAGYIEAHPRLIRPLKLPPRHAQATAPCWLTSPDGRRALVLQAMGRLFMELTDDPFRLTAELLGRHRLGANAHAIVADFHAEATSEKTGLRTFLRRPRFARRRHPHALPLRRRTRSWPAAPPSSPDAGMCGDYDSVIGMDKAVASARFWRKVPGERLAPAEGEATICGTLVTTDDATGLALSCEPVRLGGRLSHAMPGSWLRPHCRLKDAVPTCVFP